MAGLGALMWVMNNYKSVGWVGVG